MLLLLRTDPIDIDPHWSPFLLIDHYLSSLIPLGVTHSLTQRIRVPVLSPGLHDEHVLILTNAFANKTSIDMHNIATKHTVKTQHMCLQFNCFICILHVHHGCTLTRGFESWITSRTWGESRVKLSISQWTANIASNTKCKNMTLLAVNLKKHSKTPGVHLKSPIGTNVSHLMSMRNSNFNIWVG